jgi:hypothetical protein
MESNSILPVTATVAANPILPVTATVAAVCSWLDGLNVSPDVVELFRTQDINGRVLHAITDENLKSDIKVATFGKRQLVMEHIKNWRSDLIRSEQATKEQQEGAIIKRETKALKEMQEEMRVQAEARLLIYISQNLHVPEYQHRVGIQSVNGSLVLRCEYCPAQPIGLNACSISSLGRLQFSKYKQHLTTDGHERKYASAHSIHRDNRTICWTKTNNMLETVDAVLRDFPSFRSGLDGGKEILTCNTCLKRFIAKPKAGSLRVNLSNHNKSCPRPKHARPLLQLPKHARPLTKVDESTPRKKIKLTINLKKGIGMYFASGSNNTISN